MTPTKLSRRQMMTTATSAVFLGGVAPAILGAEEKSGRRPPTVGEGEFQFACQHNWGQLPKHIRWRNTHGVAVDRDGFVYISHQGDPTAPCDTVVVFDPEGTYVRSFGKEFAGGGHGIDLRREDGTDFLYLCDIRHRQVIKCDTRGEWVWKIRYPREAGLYDNVDAFRPTNVCFAENGDFFVGDGYGSSYLHQYNREAQWIRSWGGHGSQPGKFRTPHGQWLDNRLPETQRIVVADRANSRLQLLSLTGEPLQILQGQDSSTSAARDSIVDQSGREVPVVSTPAIGLPADIDIWENLLVVADLHARVLLFDEQYHLVAHLGEDPDWTTQVLDGMHIRRQPEKWRPGKFVHPHDACFDSDGNLFVTEWVEAGRVSKLVWL